MTSPPLRGAASVLCAIAAVACIPGASRSLDATGAEAAGGSLSLPAMADTRRSERLAMVSTQIEARGVVDARVLASLREVPRHEFVPEALRDLAYADRPLPIGHGQTISQPFIVAVMTERARIGPGSRVLEVGTGSGYQAAVVHAIAGAVYSIEIVEPLAREAAETLARLGYANAHVRHGDGYQGWPEAAPFDAILVTAAPEAVPAPLLEQLRVGGRLVIPVGGVEQHLEVHTRTAAGVEVEQVFGVRFVPMTGEAQQGGMEQTPRAGEEGP